MTASPQWSIFCDAGCGSWIGEGCPTSADARIYARHFDWHHVRSSDGNWIDVCPECWAERHPIKAPPVKPSPSAKQAAYARGGHARAAALTPERRQEIARNAVKARWAKRSATQEPAPSRITADDILRPDAKEAAHVGRPHDGI